MFSLAQRLQAQSWRLPLRSSPVFLLVPMVFACILLFTVVHQSGMFSAAPTFLAASTSSESICAPAARYLDPQALISASDPSVFAGEGGFPKLIHQSWVDRNLPVKFSTWSDSLRVKHPDWRWVLWTDADNADLIAKRHPKLNETYWALRSPVQRADLVRNLYMWDYGGVYADLDMECLRPLESLLSPPYHHLNPSYPVKTGLPTEHRSDFALAFAGSMEYSRPEHYVHSIPNAFMASTPHHPLWLLPLSQLLSQLHADADGKGGQIESVASVESMTGPEALLHAVEAYRAWQGETGKRSDQVSTTIQHLVHPSLQPLVREIATHHEVLILDPPIIYPFSWSLQTTDPVYQICRASPYYPFEPHKCLEACRAYERGARMITYWSHTWKQTGNGKDLSVVGT